VLNVLPLLSADSSFLTGEGRLLTAGSSCALSPRGRGDSPIQRHKLASGLGGKKFDPVLWARRDDPINHRLNIRRRTRSPTQCRFQRFLKELLMPDGLYVRIIRIVLVPSLRKQCMMPRGTFTKSPAAALTVCSAKRMLHRPSTM
jgi:hypothetical protein